MRIVLEGLDLGSDDLSAGAESGEWADLGRQLRRLDPKRYLELADIVERLVLIYTDPENPKLDEPGFPVVASQRPRGLS